MKQVLFFLMLATLASCSQEHPFTTPIVEHIKTNSLGLDLKPTIKKVAVVDTVTVQESLNEWYALNNDGNDPVDSVEAGVEELIQLLKNNNDDMGSNDGKIKLWEHKLSRLKSLKQRAGVDYYVVNTKYEITNPVLNNARQEVDVVYLIRDGKVIVETNKKELEQYSQSSKLPHTKYEIAMLK